MLGRVANFQLLDDAPRFTGREGLIGVLIDLGDFPTLSKHVHLSKRRYRHIPQSISLQEYGRNG